MVSTTKPTVGYSVGWVREFLQRGSGLAFDENQASDVVVLAERKLFDLFDVAATTALANGRAKIFRYDLPLTKGLQHELAEAETLAGELELRPLLVFLADSGVPGPIDDSMRDDVPRLMAALLLLAGRIIAILEPSNVTTEERLGRLLRQEPLQPTSWELERASQVLNLTV
jgi:Domain of unknown function (DUF1931)